MSSYECSRRCYAVPARYLHWGHAVAGLWNVADVRVMGRWTLVRFEDGIGVRYPSDLTLRVA